MGKSLAEGSIVWYVEQDIHLLHILDINNFFLTASKNNRRYVQIDSILRFYYRSIYGISIASGN